nr:hypothetical protein [Massilibacillus massiliensis]
MIQTNEAIYVEKDICGTYHSKVKLVSKGLSHISTTLDPYFFGTSLIAVTNHSKKDIVIDVNDTFASLIFYKMASSSKLLHDNQAFRSDILPLNFTDKHIKDEITPANKEKLLCEIKKWKEAEWRIEKDHLIDIVKRKVREKNKIKNRSFLRKMCTGVLPIFIVIISIIILYNDSNLSIANSKNAILFPALCGLSGWIGKATYVFINLFKEEDEDNWN